MNLEDLDGPGAKCVDDLTYRELFNVVDKRIRTVVGEFMAEEDEKGRSQKAPSNRLATL